MESENVRQNSPNLSRQRNFLRSQRLIFLYHRQVHSHIKHAQLYNQTILRFCEQSIKKLVLVIMGWLLVFVCQRIHQEESAKRVTLRSQRLILFFSSFKVTQPEIYLHNEEETAKIWSTFLETQLISIEKKTMVRFCIQRRE